MFGMKFASVAAEWSSKGMTATSILQVPKQAPATREQWKDCNQVWPISWRKPELTGVPAATACQSWPGSLVILTP